MTLLFLVLLGILIPRFFIPIIAIMMLVMGKLASSMGAFGGENKLIIVLTLILSMISIRHIKQITKGAIWV